MSLDDLVGRDIGGESADAGDDQTEKQETESLERHEECSSGGRSGGKIAKAYGQDCLFMVSLPLGQR